VRRFYAKKKQVTLKLPPYVLHRLDNGPSTEAVLTREQALDYYTQMSRYRRMETSAQALYQRKLIRGFLHLYNGQEAVVTGIDNILTSKDSVITAYRDHPFICSPRTGGTVKEVLAELCGKVTGCSKGKGGSMHMYKISHGFYGGNGIVGAQIPLGTGLAFSHKYKNDGRVSVAMMGDGAANQGQVYESYNMAKIWGLPIIYVIENNRYGMGTSVKRASATENFYTRGDYIPGIQVDGMNVLSVREAIKFSVQYVNSNGPILLEILTYRYKGHSMSDPGVSYRKKEEILEMEENFDPIKYVQKAIIENDLGTVDELQKIDEEIQKEVEEATAFAIESQEPPKTELYHDIYVEEQSLRGRDYTEHHVAQH